MKDYPKLPPLPTTTTKPISFRGKDEVVTLYTDGLWRDSFGTIIGIADEGYSGPNADNRAGYGVFSLPASDPVNSSATPHDYKYSSSAYQEFHTRKEADEDLYNSLRQQPTERHSFLPWIFYGIVRLVGGYFWENKSTNK